MPDTEFVDNLLNELVTSLRDEFLNLDGKILVNPINRGEISFKKWSESVLKQKYWSIEDIAIAKKFILELPTEFENAEKRIVETLIGFENNFEILQNEKSQLNEELESLKQELNSVVSQYSELQKELSSLSVINKTLSVDRDALKNEIKAELFEKYAKQFDSEEIDKKIFIAVKNATDKKGKRFIS